MKHCHSILFSISLGTGRKDQMPSYHEGDGETHEE